MPSTYKQNNVSFGRYMLSDDVRDALMHEARRIVAYLKSTAPRESGAYANSFMVSGGRDVRPTPRSGPRAAAFVVNDSPYATALEVGSWTIKNPPAPMTRLAASTHRHRGRRGRQRR